MSCRGCKGCEQGGPLVCPVCGAEKLFGPAEVKSEGKSWYYYDCARCHTLLPVVDGKLEARAGAW